MQYDYYAFCKEQLVHSLNELERAKEISDKTERKHVIEKAATNAVKIEPHLSYLWYEALESDLKNSIRDAWQKNLIVENFPEDFQFIPDVADLKNLPAFSFMLRVPFKLQKPYLSKGDRSFHLLDNPIQKDKVFQTPIVTSTSWKGALHNAMLQQFVEWWCNLDERDSRTFQKQFVARRISLIRLFGTEKVVQINEEKPESYLDNLGNDHLSKWYRRYIQRKISATGFFSGRLYFYPTFFDKIGLEVINPHDRKQGTGKNPILIESVPIGITGEFVVLYVPFGKVEKNQVIEDLELVVRGVKEMLTTYAFGAKTSSGFGTAEISKHEDFPSKEEYKKSRLEAKKTYSEKIYEDAKALYESEKTLSPKVDFANASELRDRAKEIAAHLCNGVQV